MAVVDLLRHANAVDVALVGYPDDRPFECFCCGNPMMARIAVVWRGYLATILLHPDCAQRLAAHFARDSLNAQLLAKGGSVTSGTPEHFRQQIAQMAAAGTDGTDPAE